jgi:hypothetical protein
MGYIRTCQVGAVLCWLLGIVLHLETRLGRTILPWEGPDATSGTAAGFILFLGVLLWVVADLGALRRRVGHLEQRLRDIESKES